MTDDLDPDDLDVELDPELAARFAGLDAVPAADIWDRAVERSMAQADEPGRSRLLLAAAIVLLVGGMVVAVAFAAGRGADDVVPVDTTPSTETATAPSTEPSTVTTQAPEGASPNDGVEYRGTDAVGSHLLPLPEAPRQRWTIRSGEDSFADIVDAGEVIAAVQYRFPLNEVVGIERSDGSVRWRATLDTPAANAFVNVEYVDGAVLASVNQQAGTTWFGLDTATGEVLWQTFDDADSGQEYRSYLSMFSRFSADGGLEKISGATGEVVRTIPPMPADGKGSATDNRIQQITGTVVALYDVIDFSEVLAPTDLGVEVDEVVDAGDAIMGFVEADHRLIAFDLDGRQLATLDMQPPDRGDEQSSTLHPVIAERPTVLRTSARRQEVVEFADGELRVTATFEYAGFGTVEHVNGRTLYSVEVRESRGVDDVGLVDVVDISAGRVLATVEGGVQTFANGLVTWAGDPIVVTAVDFDGAPLWPSGLTQAITSNPSSPTFLDGAVLVGTEDANGPLYSLWE